MPAKRASDPFDECCLIITGAPAAGKSTIGQWVAEALPRSARLNGDFVHELIVGGFASGPDAPPEQRLLTHKNLGSLAVNFSDEGFTPVIDALIPDRTMLDHLLAQLAPLRVLLVVLVPTIDTHHYRNTIRNWEEQFFFEGYEELLATMRAGYGDVGWWFDTTSLTPEETAKRVLTDALSLATI